MTRRNLLKSAAAAGLVGERMKADDLNTTVRPLFEAHNFRGQISAPEVEELMRQKNANRETLMLALLPIAKQKAHVPVSNYHVGAVALGSSGSLYLGQNIEVDRCMLSLAVHAEQSAIANAYMSGEAAIDAIAVTAAPCGHCRQFLAEACFDRQLRVLVANSAPTLLSELLPQSFGPSDLGLNRGVFPAQRIKGKLHLKNALDSLVEHAFQAACNSYSPYSKSLAGFALETSTGRTFAGSYIENAAFNPSLPPLQAALAGYFAAGSTAGTIKRTVLVGSDQGFINHEAGTRLVLLAIAEQSTFEYLTFSPV